MPEPMVHLTTCHDPIQAEFFKSFLNEQGMHVRLSNDRPGWTGRYGTISRGVRLEIPRHELQQARALLKDAEAGKFALSEADLIAASGAVDDEAAPDSPYRPTACPGCGSTNIFRMARRGLLFFMLNLLFLGLPWLLAPTTWACADCGCEWSREEAQASPPEEQ